METRHGYDGTHIGDTTKSKDDQSEPEKIVLTDEEIPDLTEFNKEFNRDLDAHFMGVDDNTKKTYFLAKDMESMYRYNTLSSLSEMETRHEYEETHISDTTKPNDDIQPEPEKIVLTDEEIADVVEVNKKLDVQFMCVDTNMENKNNIKRVLGICAHRQLNPFIISSYKRVGKWVEATSKYGFFSSVCITLSALLEPSVEDGDQIYVQYYRGRYYITDLFRAYINQGSLIIYDDFQLINNPTNAPQKAMKTIYDEVITANSTSRVLQKPSQLSLIECQVPCYNESIEHLTKQFSTINVSMTGMGKSIITLAACITKNLTPFVISTPSSLISWENECGKYGVTDFIGITYQRLRGSKGNINHEYLAYYNDKYYPTSALQELIRNGTMFIFDEVQLAKNPKTGIMKACHAITKEVVRMNTTSRVAILSATPYDKVQFSESILKIAGIVTHDQMYYYDRSERKYVLEGYGLHQLIGWCDKISYDKTNSLLTAKKITKKVIINMCHTLFTGVIKDAFVTKAIGERPTNLIIKNGYFKLSKYGSKRIKEIENDMVEATGFDKVTGKIGSKIDLGSFQKAIHDMENVKLEIVARVVRKKLMDGTNSKVAVYLWHRDSIDELCRLLHDYDPQVINGSVTGGKRRIVMERFQAPTNKYELVVLNIASGSEAISLDDTTGDRPRTCYIIPNFHYTKLAQATGRFQRMSSMSDAEVYFIFSESQDLEPRINAAMASKEKVVHDIVDGSGQQKIASAGRYDETD